MQNLLKIYVITGAVFGGGYYLYRFNYGTSKVKKQSYYKDSLELLKGYKPAVNVLGGKIEVDEFDEDDKFNEISDRNAKIKMVVKGDKKLADFFVYASREDMDKEWNVDTLEIKYRGSANKFKIFDRSLINQTTLNTTSSLTSSTNSK